MKNITLKTTNQRLFSLIWRLTHFGFKESAYGSVSCQIFAKYAVLALSVLKNV